MILCVWFLAHLKIFESTPSAQPIKLFGQVNQIALARKYCKKEAEHTGWSNFLCVLTSLAQLFFSQLKRITQNPFTSETNSFFSIHFLWAIERIIFRIWQIDDLNSNVITNDRIAFHIENVEFTPLFISKQFFFLLFEHFVVFFYCYQMTIAHLTKAFTCF